MSVILYCCTALILTKNLVRKARLEIRKNAACCLEQILKAAPHKIAAKRSFTIQERHAEHCWKSRNEFIRYVHQWNLTHRLSTVWQPAKAYIHQLNADTGWCLEDLPSAIGNRDKWHGRVKGILFCQGWWKIMEELFSKSSKSIFLPRGSRPLITENHFKETIGRNSDKQEIVLKYSPRKMFQSTEKGQLSCILIVDCTNQIFPRKHWNVYNFKLQCYLKITPFFFLTMTSKSNFFPGKNFI